MHKLRNSNIELLRIVAMFFIISHHFLVHGMNIWQNSSWDNLTLLSLDSLFFIGVNVFVLISGYYTIRFDWKKLLRLYLLAAIIGGVGYMAHLIIDDASLGRSFIYNTIFSISHAPGTWFIKTYIFLFFLSPILNSALNGFDRKQTQLVLILLTIISVYFGWFWQDDINKDGYNLINFVWIYCIGYYLSHYFNHRKISCFIYLLISIICSIFNAVISIFIEAYQAWAYNNPLVVFAAISFFLFFLSFNFSSKFVNCIASSTLGVYLIHENAYISPLLYKEQCVTFYSSNVVSFFLSVMGVFVICSIIDYGIRILIANPLLKLPSTPSTSQKNTINS